MPNWDLGGFGKPQPPCLLCLLRLFSSLHISHLYDSISHWILLLVDNLAHHRDDFRVTYNGAF